MGVNDRDAHAAAASL